MRRKCSLCTLEFMFKAIDGSIWLPKRGEVANAKLVARPPPVAELVHEIDSTITVDNRTLLF